MAGLNRSLTVKDMLSLRQKFLTIISRFQITSMTNEDVLYEFYYKMLRQSEKDGLNYLERYNGTTALTTWFYKPLQNMCYSLKTRENTVGGLAINSATPLEEAPEKEIDFDGSIIYLENLNVGQTDIAAQLMAYQLLDIAKNRFAGYCSTSSKGLPRSPYYVVKCLYNGLNKAQTANVLEVSTTFVDSLLKKFLGDPEVVRIKEEYMIN